MPPPVTTESLPVAARESAVVLVDSLPGGNYTDFYQPYRNPLPGVLRLDLINAVHELQATRGATSTENILELRNTLAGVATGEVTDPVIITGRCSEPVDAEHYTIEYLVKESLQMLGIAKQGLGRVITILRNRGQNGKPRTLEFQALDTGDQVLSHYGDMVNGADRSKRELDPSRLVATAVQARDVEAGLNEKLGRHAFAAHEALILPYEQSFIRTGEDGRLWSESGDLLWLGDRTRRLNGPHVEMLAKIENPIGVKLGPTATPDDVKALYDKLNPRRLPGKVAFMIRTGLDNEALTGYLLDAIKASAPHSVLLYDLHGSNIAGQDGRKIRAVSRIIAEIDQLHRLCQERGLRLHGAHLETQPTGTRRECVDEVDEIPTHKPVVDPLLNRPQTLRVYRHLGELLVDDRAAA